MAKRAEIKTDMFAKTEPTEAQPEEKKPEEKNNPKGVYLEKQEWVEFDKMAGELGMNSHKLRIYAIRYFVAQYKAGKIKTAAKTTKTLPGM